MRRFFYLAVQHQALLRILLVLVVMTAAAIYAVTPDVVLADGDGFEP
ncbi:MAG: hypothetical protein HYU83_06620 [Chloroflexi bacterium]|nr:hypothetical protein [Chloroflexota bacterium]MBI3931530.1 hypothetical protein [Chloroflexota bacterium]